MKKEWEILEQLENSISINREKKTEPANLSSFLDSIKNQKDIVNIPNAFGKLSPESKNTIVANLRAIGYGNSPKIDVTDTTNYRPRALLIEYIKKSFKVAKSGQLKSQLSRLDISKRDIGSFDRAWDLQEQLLKKKQLSRPLNRFIQAYLFLNNCYEKKARDPAVFAECDGIIGNKTKLAKEKLDKPVQVNVNYVPSLDSFKINPMAQETVAVRIDSIPNGLNVNVDVTRDTPKADQMSNEFNQSNNMELDERWRNRQNIQWTLNYINKYNKIKPSPLTVDMIKNALNLSINKKVINPVLAMSILFMESTWWIFTSKRSKKYPYWIYNVWNISCKEENQPKDYQEWLNMMIKHLNNRYWYFKECYPDDEPEPRHLLANVWPDGLWFMSNQENYRKINTNWMWSYCASKNGQIWNLKYPYKISWVANKIEEWRYA